MSDLPGQVKMVEVGPRDGLQIEPKILSTEQKLRMIDALVAAGLAEIEVGSFVNPKAVPQMADTADVFARLGKRPGVRYTALWLNPKGLERALDCGRVDIDGKLTLTASETFVKRNTNRSIDETLAEMPDWIARYRQAGIAADGLGVMAAFGCNFEGYIPQEKVVALVARAMQVMADNDSRLSKLMLADTMGWGTPRQDPRQMARARHHPASPRYARLCRGQCRGGDGTRRRDLRFLGRRARRLSLRRPPGGGRQRLHRGSGLRLRGDGHRDRNRPRCAGRGGQARRRARRPSLARQGDEGRNPDAVQGAGLTEDGR
jgi:hypothetical protein